VWACLWRGGGRRLLKRIRSAAATARLNAAVTGTSNAPPPPPLPTSPNPHIPPPLPRPALHLSKTHGGPAESFPNRDRVGFGPGCVAAVLSGAPSLAFCCNGRTHHAGGVATRSGGRYTQRAACDRFSGRAALQSGYLTNMSAAPATASLVKYESATVVTGRARKPKLAVPKLDRKTASALPATEDLLSAILPPREWTADGVLWVQHVSPTPATRIDVVNLQVRAQSAFPSSR